LRTGFEIWPTTDEDADIDPQIQAVHFDIVLPSGGYALPTGATVHILTEQQFHDANEALATPVDQLLSMFLRRRAR
jgi:hypothetical protein